MSNETEILAETESPLHSSESEKGLEASDQDVVEKSPLEKESGKEEEKAKFGEDKPKEEVKEEEKKTKSEEDNLKKATDNKNPEKKASTESKGPSKGSEGEANSPVIGSSNEKETTIAGEKNGSEVGPILALLGAIFNFFTSAINAVTSFLFGDKATKNLSVIASKESRQLAEEGKEDSSEKGGSENSQESPQKGGTQKEEEKQKEERRKEEEKKKEEEEKQKGEKGREKAPPSLDNVMPGGLKKDVENGPLSESEEKESKLGGLPGMTDVVNSMKGSVAKQTDGATSSPVSAPAAISAPAPREGGR